MEKIYTAITTVLNKDKHVDKEAMKGIIKYNEEIAKVDGIYVNGSTGEFPMLTLAQKKEVLAITMEATSNKENLIAQVGSTSYHETAELGKYAIELGYKTLSIISPFYFKADFDTLYKYYENIAKEFGDTKILPYYIPGLTGITFNKDELKKILEIKNVIGIKFSSPDIQLLTQVKNENKDKKIYWGWDEMMAAGLLANVDGFIGSTYALNGINARKLLVAWNENNIPKVQKLTISNMEIILDMVGNNLMETIKFAILDYYGLEQGIATLPTKSLTKDQQEFAKKLLVRINE